MNITLIFILLLQLIASEMQSQSFLINPVITNGSIGGTIIDSISNEPMIGVNCLLDSTNLGARTNKNGQYLIDKVPAGFYRLHLSMIGYKPKIINNIKVVSSKLTQIDASVIDRGTSSALEELSKGEILIWQSGFMLPCDIPDSSITDKYGFRYGGPTVDPVSEYKHNVVIEQYLDKRNGKGWKEKVDLEWNVYVNEWHNGIRWIYSYASHLTDTLILNDRWKYKYYKCNIGKWSKGKMWQSNDTLLLFEQLNDSKYLDIKECAPQYKYLIRDGNNKLISISNKQYILYKLRK